jgi:Protein of unknown function (DUF4089)
MFGRMRTDPDDVSNYLDMASKSLELPIRPEHRGEVMTAALALAVQARLVAEFALPEAVEAAPRFVP